MNLRPFRRLFLLGTLCILLTSCTIIRYVDNNDSGNGGNGELAPQSVDALVLVDLPRGAANIMARYSLFLSMSEALLAEQNIHIQNLAIAPLYRTQSERPPLLYGRGDSGNAFSYLEEALHFYVSDDGLAILDGATDADGENLATLGMNLDRETIFNPLDSLYDSTPYFGEAADGFLVFYLTGSSRRCDYNDADCELNLMDAADYFTEIDNDSGHATWLNMASSSGLPPSRIMHISIATAEGIDYDDFAAQCLRESQFPASYLGILEPSHNAYFGPFIDALNRDGGHGHHIDLCTAFSARSERSAAYLSVEIARMLR